MANGQQDNPAESGESNRTIARELIESVHRLANLVRKLDEDFYKRRTLWWSFSHGILYGVGTVLGAGLIAVLLLYLLSQFQDIPWLGNILDRMAEQATQKFEIQQKVEEGIIQSLTNP